MHQIHDFGTYIPMDDKLISRENKMNSLYSLMFTVDKRDGRFKAQNCSVSSKQRTFPGYVKSDWASPWSGLMGSL